MRRLSRRQFLTMAVAMAAARVSPWGAAATPKVVVGAHPWVYPATQPKHDITPVLPQIFADMSYAGMDGIELMSTALLPDDAVERIGELSRKHRLAVIGMSGGVDPVAFIRQYGKQIVFLHLRDQKKDGRWSEALGEGDMDYVAIAAALREIDFSGHAIIELAHERGFQLTRPLRESFKMSREFVRNVLGY